MTHQTTAKRFLLFSRMASVVLFTGRCSEFVCFCNGRTDGQTPCVKIMTTYSVVAFVGQYTRISSKHFLTHKVPDK